MIGSLARKLMMQKGEDDPDRCQLARSWYAFMLTPEGPSGVLEEVNSILCCLIGG